MTCLGPEAAAALAAMAKVLVVDDEPDILQMLMQQLRASGMEVVGAGTAREALQIARTEGPDLVLLDLMLPDLDGLEVCKRLRRDPITERIPVIMVSARGSEMDRVLGFELGADDYIIKPFSPRELVLRVRRSLERQQPPPVEGDLLSFGELTIDVPGHRVLVRGKGVDITATEFRLLTVLARRRGRVQTRDHLLQEVWTHGERDEVDVRTVDTHVRRLREKLGAAADLVETVRGVGYRFASP
jgi:two-component system phosphate regulon response regulator PhoB